MIRIPYWPGRRLTLGGRPQPAAVTVQLPDRPAQVTRLASAPGWMVLAVRYNTGPPPTEEQTRG